MSQKMSLPTYDFCKEYKVYDINMVWTNSVTVGKLYEIEQFKISKLQTVYSSLTSFHQNTITAEMLDKTTKANYNCVRGFKYFVQIKSITVREQKNIEQYLKFKSRRKFLCPPTIFCPNQNPTKDLDARSQHINQIYLKQPLPS